MSSSHEEPRYAALLAEQAAVQAGKFQGRLLDEYSSYIFPGLNWRKPRGSAVADFVKPVIGSTAPATLDGVLAGLGRAKAGAPVHWADMGGGRALPMRQLGRVPGARARLRMTNVDLFDFGLDGLKPDELAYLEGLAPGVTAPESGPALVTGNAETVLLPEPADIITSVELMQYLGSPLEALANWYNQLADNGMLIVATEHDWPSWIRYRREAGGREPGETPSRHLLEAFSQAGIRFAVTDECDSEKGFRPDADPGRFRVMTVQRKPGTSLTVTQPVTHVWVNPSHYKAAYYEVPAQGSPPVVAVTRTAAAPKGPRARSSLTRPPACNATRPGR